MYNGFYEDGDKCPECSGILEYKLAGDCSCHISPPCKACTDATLACCECGYEPDEPDHKYISSGYPGLSIKQYKPKPLDKNKIDWRCKPHSGSSMIKEGVYPTWATIEDVRKKVDGTFGGRFSSFGYGKFIFIAYTD